MSKFFLAVASLALLIFLIVWLWQRQPSGPTILTAPQETDSKNDQKQNSQTATAKPQDNLVVSSQAIKIKGKLNPNDYLIIASNSFNKIVKTGDTGEFEVEVSLQKGLNLIDYISVSSDLKNVSKSSLTYYNSAEKKFKSVYAGTVKSIFDTLLTITTTSGEFNARTSRSTKLDIPQPEEESDIEESTSTALRNIRVGDYAISLGVNSDQNTQVSESITIVRDDKPQNNTTTVTAQIATTPKQNTFSAKNMNDSNILELVTNIETVIQSESVTPSPTPSPKASPASQIVKDKNAIIIYHQEKAQNIVDLIYLLP